MKQIIIIRVEKPRRLHPIQRPESTSSVMRQPGIMWAPSSVFLEGEDHSCEMLSPNSTSSSMLCGIFYKAREITVLIKNTNVIKATERPRNFSKFTEAGRGWKQNQSMIVDLGLGKFLEKTTFN